MPLDTLGALSGSTGGALLIYIGPALMTLKLRAQQQKQQQVTSAGAAGTGMAADAGLWAVVATGAALAVIGTVDSLGVQI